MRLKTDLKNQKNFSKTLPMSNEFVIFSTKNGLLPVPPDGVEGEVDGDLTVMRALQHVAGLQAVQEPLHQGYAPTTTTTYNRTT